MHHYHRSHACGVMSFVTHIDIDLTGWIFFPLFQSLYNLGGWRRWRNPISAKLFIEVTRKRSEKYKALWVRSSWVASRKVGEDHFGFEFWKKRLFFVFFLEGFSYNVCVMLLKVILLLFMAWLTMVMCLLVLCLTSFAKQK